MKNLALMTHITVDSDEQPVVQLAYSIGVEDVDTIAATELHRPDRYLCFLNGSILGITRRPQHFVRVIRLMRRCGMLNEFVRFMAAASPIHAPAVFRRTTRSAR